MLTYPQLTHFPIVRRRRRRTVVNAAEDGRAIKLADPAGSFTEWRLEYSDLSDSEAGSLEEFFVAAEGSLREFVFVDPTANLLAWNAKLDEAVWARDPLLAVSAEDGYTRLTNVGTGPQAITQTIDNGPSGFMYCFSVYARSENAASVHLLADGAAREQAIVPDWRRLRWSGTVENARFGLRIGAAGVVDVRGLQVEAQAGASAARETTIGGIYKGARLQNDRFRLVATGQNRHSCTVNIVHANHI
jgi:hypothetical protein